MLGWTLLLAWGARRPIERRALLLLTLPVIAGFMALELLDVNLGHADIGGTLPTLMIQSVLAAGLVVAYAAAGRVGPESQAGTNRTMIR
jgi:hypothetical protein